MSILVTGGAGYIGSHTVKELLENKEDVVIIDNLETGHKQAVVGGKLYVGDIRDGKTLEAIFKENRIDAVIHFAAYSIVGESVKNPSKYYDNNLNSTRILLDTMLKYGCNKIVFSSTAAVFGEPENIPILENDKMIPTNPYGQTKVAMEKMLKWYDEAYGIKYIALRYFNAAGADESGIIGEDHLPETHLIPILLDIATGKKEKILIYGDDYPTKDGTCIRDYIHVTDLANAHVLAIEKLKRVTESTSYNLGSGKGYSVKEVIDTVEEVTKKRIERKIVSRRMGDPAVLIASSEKAHKELGWKPKYNSLNTIIQTAWNFKKKHINGFEDK